MACNEESYNPDLLLIYRQREGEGLNSQGVGLCKCGNYYAGSTWHEHDRRWSFPKKRTCKTDGNCSMDQACRTYRYFLMTEQKENEEGTGEKRKTREEDGEAESATRSTRPVLEDASTNTASTTTTTREEKKPKTTTKPNLLTFLLQPDPKNHFTHPSIEVEILDSNTISNLVHCLCEEAGIGHRGWNPDAHAWVVSSNGTRYYNRTGIWDDDTANDVAVPENRQAHLVRLHDLDYSRLHLEYEFGRPMHYDIVLQSSEVYTAESSFAPRRKKQSVPAGFQPVVITDMDLNTTLSSFQKFAFGGEKNAELERELYEGNTAQLHLFQPGRKQNFGFLERGGNMIYIPTKPGNSLGDYLYVLDQGCIQRSSGGTSWYSNVVLEKHMPDNILDKYDGEEDAGFCDVTIVDTNNNQNPNLEQYFPKVAALAGYRKDSKVKKGWITFSNQQLRICRGNSLTKSSNAPKQTAYDGRHQHEPASSSDVLLQMDINITSVHQLFCAVEGLLRTL